MFNRYEGHLTLPAYLTPALSSSREYTDMEDDKWDEGENYQAAMDLYLGTLSADTSYHPSLGFASFVNIIRGEYSPAKVEF